MEPNKQGDAALSNPAADLEIRLNAMRLGDPSSSPPPLNPQRVLVPNAAPVARTPPRVLAPPLQRQPHPLSFHGGESSTSSTSASHHGGHSRLFNAPAAPAPSVAQKPSNLNTSAEEFRFRHISPFHRPLMESMLYSSANRWQPPASRPLPVATASFSTLDEARAQLLRGPMSQVLVSSAQCSGFVVRLLAEEDDDEVRLSVLEGVKRALPRAMVSIEWHSVFHALLRACEGRFDELEGIIEAVCNGSGHVRRILEVELGLTALKDLIRVVAPNRLLTSRLIGELLHDRVMEQNRGPVVLRHCFAVLPYEDCTIIIWLATDSIHRMLCSPRGSRCLAVCYANARNPELQALEEIILRHTNNFAKGKYSSYFLQEVLRCCSEQLRSLIAERLAADIVGLCNHTSGRYVVRSLLLRAPSLATQQHLLAAFLALHQRELRLVVQGQASFSTDIVRLLLWTTEHDLPIPTTALARRIEAVRAEILAEDNAKLVWRFIPQ